MRRVPKRLLETLISCVALGSVACATESAAPADRLLSPPDAGSAAAALSAAGRRIVTFTSGIPQTFAADVAALGGSVKFSHGNARLAVVQGLSDASAASLSARPGVATVEPDVVVAIGAGKATTMGAPAALAARVGAAPSSTTNPADAIFYGIGFQWNMAAIGADQAWSQGKLGSPTVTVAIIDSGIDYLSFDLAGLVDLTRSISLVPSDDALVATFFAGVNASTDLHGHGTHVASQVVSNAFAFAGVTSRTRLIAVKALPVGGFGFLSDVIIGIIYAADQGADIANLSVLSYIAPQHFGRVVASLNSIAQYAYKNGMLLVAGAGNDALNLDKIAEIKTAWCDLIHVVCVSATGPLTPTTSPFAPAIYSNYGRSAISVAAPGGNFGGPVSVWPWGPFSASLVWGLCSRTTILLDGNGNPVSTPYTAGNVACGNVGTSLATPHVSGLAALLVAEYGDVGPARLKTLLTARTIDMGQPGRDPFYGWGHIHVGRALGLSQ